MHAEEEELMEEEDRVEGGDFMDATTHLGDGGGLHEVVFRDYSRETRKTYGCSR